MRAVLHASVAIACLAGGCSDRTRHDGSATAKSAVHDLKGAAADLKRDTAPLRHDLTHVADRAQADAHHLVDRANREMGHASHP